MQQTIADMTDPGPAMYNLVRELYPLFRSITGDGVRATLRILQDYVPLDVHEVPTGTRVFDWEVPAEWNISAAWIEDEDGHRVVDIRRSNLHLVNYSMAVHQRLTWEQLKPRLFTLPETPDWIPYRTAYYEQSWGFCLTHRQFLELEQRGRQREYTVHIDSSLKDGSLTYGELFLPGETDEEVLISTHVCHPSLANDNLSGIAVSTFLAKHLLSHGRRYSYRFLYIPATIGAITWLALNQPRLDNIRHGLTLALLGDPGQMTYKKSRGGNAQIDRAAAHVLKHHADAHTIVDFEPIGYDERQFCSPGIDLPMGCLMRSRNGMFPEYHTSADDLSLVQPAFLADSWRQCVAIIDVLEHNRIYINLNPKCEPRLGKRGLYHAFGHEPDAQQMQQAVLWVLNLSDGGHSLLDVAVRSGNEFPVIRRAAELLLEHDLLKESPATDACQSTPEPSTAGGWPLASIR
jgi:aminopeptidase-like protein